MKIKKKVEKKDFNIKTEESEPMGQLEYVTIFPSDNFFWSGRNISKKIERPYLQKRFRKNEENLTSYVRLCKFQRKHAEIGHDSQKLVPHLTLFQGY